jgi:DNA-binding CsgD family transcriptional regulator
VLAATAPDLSLGLGMWGATARIVNGHLYPQPPMVAYQLEPASRAAALALHPTFPCPILDAFVSHAVVAGGLDEALPKQIRAATAYRRGMSSTGAVDAFLLYAGDSEGGAVEFVAPSPKPLRTHPRVRATWGRVMQHVAAALRLRHRVRAGIAPDAVIDTDGRVHDAGNELASDDALRARVCAELGRVEDARRTLRDEPEAATRIWRGLVAGRYSLVDRWERDGRRFVVVYRNDPAAPDPRALGRTEAAVVEQVGRGASNKEVAYALGVSTDAVVKALASSLEKLGLSHRRELASLVAGTASLARVVVGDQELEALVTSIAAAEPSGALSEAERGVLKAIVRGASNAEIAAGRGTSPRTVANQVQRIFAKLGVGSRHQLQSLVLGARS